MKVLLDMGLAIGTARFLGQCGMDAAHLRDRRLQRLVDEAIVELAADEGRVILSFDLDFPRLLAARGANLPSLVLFRLQQVATAEMNMLALDTLIRFEQVLTRGAIVVVEEHRIRVRKLPLAQEKQEPDENDRPR